MENHDAVAPKKLTRILYAEDEPDIQAVVKLVLEKLGGYDLLVCSSGAEAIAKGAAFAPDLLLLDVMMPGMDGPTTLMRMRDLPGLARTPAMFMTAKVQPAEVDYFKSLRVLDVISKPFDPMQLVAQVQRTWDLQHG